MKMVIAIVQDQDANEVTRSLRRHKVPHTSLRTRGGFLQRGSVMLWMGVEEAKVDSVLEIIDRHCKEREVVHKPDFGALHADIYASPVTVPVGGAVIFILNVEEFRKL